MRYLHHKLHNLKAFSYTHLDVYKRQDYGLQSVAVIAFVLDMVVWFAFYFKRHMDEDAKNAGK